MDQTSMPPDRSGRTGSGDPVRAPSATRGQGGDLVGGLDGGGGRQRTGESALLAQVEAGGAAPADGGVQAGHGESSRFSVGCGGEKGCGPGRGGYRRFGGGEWARDGDHVVLRVTVEPGSSRCTRPRADLL